MNSVTIQKTTYEVLGVVSAESCEKAGNVRQAKTLKAQNREYVYLKLPGGKFPYFSVHHPEGDWWDEVKMVSCMLKKED